MVKHPLQRLDVARPEARLPDTFQRSRQILIGNRCIAANAHDRFSKRRGRQGRSIENRGRNLRFL
jgi:hypothetical protein